MRPETKGAVIISGGGTGIGYATAEYLARLGCPLSIVGRRREVIERAAATLSETTGTDVIGLAEDIGTDGAAERIVAGHLARHGALSGLVSAAGVYEQISFLDMTAGAWDRINSANLRGSFLLSLAAARTMAPAGAGRIVLIGSVLHAAAEPMTSAYSVTKAGMSALVRGMAVDLAPTGVRVNCVAPGWVRTPIAAAEIDAFPPEAMVRINPLGRAADPAEIASVVAYLLRDAPDFLTGQTICVDGGQTARAATL
ncbi:MAG: SDR family oxidoreductase [Amaricoccus sp.]